MQSSDSSYEAILFFVGATVSREMLYPEFEALLDCVVPMLDFRGHDVPCAYVRFDNRLRVSAVVLFRLSFDDTGYVDRDWNVPIQMLAERADTGPDLGAGPIRLASRSACPVAGQEAVLWDPGGDTYNVIRERLAQNRLGIDVSENTRQQASAGAAVSYSASVSTNAPGVSATSPALPLQASAAAAQPLAGFAALGAPGAAADAMLAMMQQSNAQIAMLREQHQNELVAMQQRLTAAQQQIHALENEKQLLLKQINQVSESSEVDRAESAARVQALQREMDAHLAAATEQLRLQLEQDLAARESVFQAELARAHEQAENARSERKVAMDQLAALRGEITDLRRDKIRLLDDGADAFFERLKSRNIKFVSFQPGAGHLTVAMDELTEFLEGTETYVANRCGVTVAQYQLWLSHYNNPVCQGTGGDGRQCAKPLQRQLKPSEFVTGLNDRCEIHKQVPRSAPPPAKSVG